jgi:hypothetical protein
MHPVERLLGAGVEQVFLAFAEQIGGEDRGRDRRAYQKMTGPGT